MLLFLLAAGASPLGVMLNSSELASWGLPLAPGSEDPLTAVAGSTTSSNKGESCKVVASGVTPVTGHSGVSASASQPPHTTGFSLGHGFPLIPLKLVTKILKWEYVSMVELLPDNLELAR